MPAWMLAPRGASETSKIYFGYAEEGLYIAAEITDSKSRAANPRDFWVNADCMEIGFNSTPDFTPGRVWTQNDHQFWLCPIIGENRVYAGLWGRTEGQPTDYDIKGVKSAAKKTADGYTMEVLIPASRIKGYNPKKGATSALTFTIAVQGLRADREIFWPSGKRDDTIGTSSRWGRVTLD